ncbi:MAG TPA: hypothetical protein EYP32_03350 [Aquificaceae bacterium]|nr:hypothetical protein [Aquificaceae bacterium]
MKLVLIILFYIVFISIAVSNPAPFGLELGKANVKDLKSKFDVEEVGINKYSYGPMFKISGKQTNIDGLKEVTFIFDKKNKLVAVIMTFPKDFRDYYWNRIFETLKNKYRLVDYRIPFVGNKFAKFVDGNSIIILEAPHLSFEISLLYATRDFWRTYNREIKLEQERKRESLYRGL